ncbi:hypothetical protein [Longirhabdus pacifica]|uniref:hypothetical protein n=1 Tax=Longirhabdus pacifica TaxID=2305227 RepID=UPI0010088B3C|nr:hypothetical protein [Longirhabdus pacifica]
MRIRTIKSKVLIIVITLSLASNIFYITNYYNEKKERQQFIDHHVMSYMNRYVNNVDFVSSYIDMLLKENEKKDAAPVYLNNNLRLLYREVNSLSEIHSMLYTLLWEKFDRDFNPHLLYFSELYFDMGDLYQRERLTEEDIKFFEDVIQHAEMMTKEINFEVIHHDVDHLDEKLDIVLKKFEEIESEENNE